MNLRKPKIELISKVFNKLRITKILKPIRIKQSFFEEMLALEMNI